MKKQETVLKVVGKVDTIGYRITGGKVLCRRKNNYHFLKRDLFCEKGYITESNPLVKYKTIDVSGKCILPALFNLHSHLGETLFYESVFGKTWNLQKYLDYTENFNACMSKEERENFWSTSAQISAQKMKEEGIIGFCAARSAEIACSKGMLTMSGYPIMSSAKLIEFQKDGLRKFQEYSNRYNSDFCETGVFFHSLYTNSEDSIRLAVNCMENGGSFLSVHVSEDYASYRKEMQKYGMTAVEALDHYGLLNSKAILVHCGYCTENDLDLISKRRATICICPISNRFLNTKMVNLYELEKRGIAWCITTDGLATGRSFSLFEQIAEARRHYPSISMDRYIDSITSTPAGIFERAFYNGTLKSGTISAFLIVDGDYDTPNELWNDLLIKANCVKMLIL